MIDHYDYFEKRYTFDNIHTYVYKNLKFFFNPEINFESINEGNSKNDKRYGIDLFK